MLVVGRNPHALAKSPMQVATCPFFACTDGRTCPVLYPLHALMYPRHANLAGNIGQWIMADGREPVCTGSGGTPALYEFELQADEFRHVPFDHGVPTIECGPGTDQGWIWGD